MQLKEKFSYLNPLQGFARSLLGLATFILLYINDLNVIFIQDSYSNEFIQKNIIKDINLFYIFGFTYSKIISLIILFFVIIGYKPRYFYFLHLWVSFSFVNACKFIEGGDQINYLITLFLCPLVLIDKRKWHWFTQNQKYEGNFRNFFSNEISFLILILISIQAFIFYFHASVGKLFVPDWVNGEALYYWFNDSFFGSPKYLKYFINTVIDNDYVIVFLTYGVLVFELLLAVCIFMPIQYKSIFCFLGILFHFSIAIIHGLPAFFLNVSAFLILYTLDYRVLKNYSNIIYKKWENKYSDNYNVYYDGNCGICKIFISKFVNINNSYFKINFIPLFDNSINEIKINSEKDKMIFFNGALGINFLLSISSKKLFFIIVIIEKLYFPLIIEKFFYRIFAKNRNIISKIINIKSCSIKD
ncbi:hypothetical protein QEJ31_07885 [Pigmentibacter sp. JX0631]|uniref:sporulation-delaying protein SdpB family protein n=1 Tax=Pigmentibacter sp. JX0631 TaxID=2976982 RepID=UPI0024687CEF|nr:sporulation-delaying protein SdpB family protein [Pigmentibacter sp. JX0631]WGL61509.1 hypothetical protein QEJ31_07885 [Pigmentibacter sp. JX0631]